MPARPDPNNYDAMVKEASTFPVEVRKRLVMQWRNKAAHHVKSAGEHAKGTETRDWHFEMGEQYAKGAEALELSLDKK